MSRKKKSSSQIEPGQDLAKDIANNALEKQTSFGFKDAVKAGALAGTVVVTERVVEKLGSELIDAILDGFKGDSSRTISAETTSTTETL